MNDMLGVFIINQMRVKILHRCWVEICIMSPFGLYRILWPRLTRNLYQPHHMNLCVHMFEWTQICMISYYSVSLIGQFINYDRGSKPGRRVKHFCQISVWNGIFSFHYVYLCVFILPAGKYAILLQCANM